MDTNFSDFVKQLNSVINSSNDVVQTSDSTHVESSITVKSIIDTNTTSNTTPKTSEKTVKVLVVSTHFNQVNGYSKVAGNIINELAKYSWIKVVHFGTQKLINADLGRKYPSDVKVIDGSALEKQKQTGFAFSELPGVINSEKPDIVFIYNDISIICAYIEEIRKAIQNRFFKIWAYVDITYQSPPRGMIDVINRDVERIFCFTKIWKEHLKTQGLTRPVDVINHGIDPKMIRLIPKELARQTLGLPKDVFMFTSMNRNIPRKRLDLLVMSFVKLITRFPMKPIFMLMIADKGDHGGYSLFEIFAREIKLAGASIDMYGNRLLITLKDTCYKDDDINILYNCGDVGVSCAEGEGFGLCSFEQMAVGVPQVVPNINGYNEYCTEQNSIMVTPNFRCYVSQVHNIVTGEAQLVNPEDFSKAMERYVFDEDLRKLHGKNAKESVSKYTWDKCCETLIKRLKSVQEEDD
jgi:glycosyltransferase involved in cell wall biosynthesis